MTSKAGNSKSTYIRVSGHTKATVEELARRFRLTQTRAAEVAVEAFEAMTPAEQRAVIERRDDRAKEADAA